MKKIVAALLCGLLSVFGFSQKTYQDTAIRVSLWAQLDAYPGLFDTDTGDSSKTEEDSKYLVPVAQLRKIAPFIISGMVYGWTFEYTPYDKARAVDEYFAFEPINELSEEEKKQIRYTKPWLTESRLSCWAEYDRTIPQKYNLEVWNSVTNPKIRGLGYARLSEGFDGIRKACGDAMKNAVREHWRQLVKNKPKEIDGRLLLCDPPMIGIDAGRYKVTLDFFMESDRIIEYKTF